MDIEIDLTKFLSEKQTLEIKTPFGQIFINRIKDTDLYQLIISGYSHNAERVEVRQ